MVWSVMAVESGPDDAPTPVFFCAEGTGISAEALGNAILQQFPTVRFVRQKLPFITTVAEAERVVGLIAQAKTGHVTPLVFTTCAVEETRAILAGCDGAVIDLFGAHLDLVERVLHVNATRAAGSGHGIGDLRRYEARMRAVEYAIEHDDGQSLRALDKADVILVAPSRCGKTPTTMYLALQHGLRVANYPLVDEDLTTSELPTPVQPHAERCFGFISTPARLSAVRHERRPNSRYASAEQCAYELRRAEAIFRAHGLPYLNSASMSVEEMAAVIMQRLRLDQAT